jgi:hypothetical protein
MRRKPLSVTVPEAILEGVRRTSDVQGRKVSDIVEDALSLYLRHTDPDLGHGAVLSALDRIHSRLTRLERAQETHFELTAHAARFSMGLAPDIPEYDEPALRSRGARRLSEVMTAIITRLSGGRSLWRSTLAPELLVPQPASAPAGPQASGFKSEVAAAHAEKQTATRDSSPSA